MSLIRTSILPTIVFFADFHIYISSVTDCGHTFYIVRCNIETFGFQKQNYKFNEFNAFMFRNTAGEHMTEALKNSNLARVHFLEHRELSSVFLASRFADPYFSCPMSRCLRCVPVPPSKNFLVKNLVILIYGDSVTTSDLQDIYRDYLFTCIPPFNRRPQAYIPTSTSCRETVNETSASQDNATLIRPSPVLVETNVFLSVLKVRMC